MAGTTITTPEDVVNAALVEVGYHQRIGSLTDGSEASQLALSIYGQARDEKLRQHDWGFAEGNVALTLLKTAPAGGYTPPIVWSSAYPILPWFFEYQYPADCIKVRALRKANFILPEFDPRPVNFRVANDPSICAPNEVILSNLPNAILVYTKRVIQPVNWEPMFTAALISDLGRKLAPALTDLNAAKAEAAEEQVDTQNASMVRG